MWAHFHHDADIGVRGIGHTREEAFEEAPGAYKDVNEVVDAADKAGLARKVALLKPVVCIKGQHQLFDAPLLFVKLLIHD